MTIRLIPIRPPLTSISDVIDSNIVFLLLGRFEGAHDIIAQIARCRLIAPPQTFCALGRADAVKTYLDRIDNGGYT